RSSGKGLQKRWSFLSWNPEAAGRSAWRVEKVGKVGNVTFLCVQLLYALLLRERPHIANRPKKLAMWPTGFAPCPGRFGFLSNHPCNAKPFSANWRNSFSEMVGSWIKCLGE